MFNFIIYLLLGAVFNRMINVYSGFDVWGLNVWMEAWKMIKTVVSFFLIVSGILVFAFFCQWICG